MVLWNHSTKIWSCRSLPCVFKWNESVHRGFRARVHGVNRARYVIAKKWVFIFIHAFYMRVALLYNIFIILCISLHLLWQKALNSENGDDLKKKLNDALQKRHLELESLSQMEMHEFMKGSPQKSSHESTNKKKRPKTCKKKKSFEEEWDVHRAYQLIISEHHKRVKTPNLHNEKRDSSSKSRQDGCDINCSCKKAKELLLWNDVASSSCITFWYFLWPYTYFIST